MSAATKIADEKILRELVPLNTLSAACFEMISGDIVVGEVRTGAYLFRVNDHDMQTVFLLGGEIDMIDDAQMSVGTIKAGSDKSRLPLADAQPRALSARALCKCVIARIDSKLLDAALSGVLPDDAGVVEDRFQIRAEAAGQPSESSLERLRTQAGKLQQERDEALVQAQIAVQMRVQAEQVCVRLKDEREVLHKQVSNNISLGKALNIPPPGKQQVRSSRAVYTARSVKTPRAGPAARKVLTAVAVKRSQQSTAVVTAAWHRTLWILGFGALVIAGLEFGLNRFVDVPGAAFRQVADKTSMFNRTVIAAGVRQNDVSPQEPQPAQLTGPDPATNAVVIRQRDTRAQGSFRDDLMGGGFAPQMVKLPAASYVMGSLGNSLNFDEGPRHEVSLSRFAISKFEVTFSDYDRFARATGLQLPNDETWGRGERPVINVSWQDAQHYVRWLSAQTGQRYRLPTESQWEFAARAGNLTAYPWSIPVGTVPANCFNCGSQWDQSSTAPVGKFPANHFGLYDMGGNVQEWTQDCYRASYDGASSDGSALLISGCTRHTVRGGAYTSPVNSLRDASRGQYQQDTRIDNLGFRITRKY